MAIATALPGLLAATGSAAPEMTWLPLNVAVVDNDRGASPNSSHIGRARLGLARNRCLQLPLGCIQGGSCCPGRVVERERARWHDPVLGRWLGLTPEQPALCLRGFPRRSRGSDPPAGWVGVREPRGRLGGLYAKTAAVWCVSVLRCCWLSNKAR
eukprot:scaffold1936_cov51-Phaeocystis_antarctica.AAC.1